MKRLFTPFVSPLARIGRQGTGVIAILIIISASLPRIGEILQPHLTAAVFCLLIIAFARIERGKTGDILRNPIPTILAILWTSLAIPAAVGLSCRILDIDNSYPALYHGLLLQSLASPIMASPALAFIMGLDGTLVLVSMIASTLLLPITVPVCHHLFLTGPLTISPLLLSKRLMLIIILSIAIGILIRRVVGSSTIQKYKHEIDGVNILIVFIFMLILMQGVGKSLFAQPHIFFSLLGIAAFVFLTLFLVTLITFLPFGRYTAVSIAFMSSQRNMGLMLAVAGSSLPEIAWLYFALSQVPIYLSPHIFKFFERVLLGVRN